MFAYTKRQQIMSDDNCLDAAASEGPVKLLRCHGMGGNQMWSYDREVCLFHFSFFSLFSKAFLFVPLIWDGVNEKNIDYGVLTFKCIIYFIQLDVHSLSLIFNYCKNGSHQSIYNHALVLDGYK